MMTVKNSLRRLALGTVATLVALVPAVPASALTFTNGFTCYVTPIAPVQSSTSVYGQFKVRCTKIATVTVEVSIVEWDGTKIQATTSSTLALAVTKMPVAATTIDTTVMTATKACWNTETGNEEYGTRVRILIGTKWSSYEITKSATDAYTC
jgi:hypothetical protein